jgi:hypothetical protein
MKSPWSVLNFTLVNALCLIGLGTHAQAQFTPTGPFTGNSYEGFETQNSTGFPACVIGRVFSDQADLCSSAGSGTNITSGWGFGCSINAQSGSRFFGCASGYAIYTFDSGATRFGGYFGNNTPSGVDGMALFYDGGGNLLYSDIITAPNNCTWTWNGWDFGSALVKTIEIRSNYGGGAFMMLDGMEADLIPGNVGTVFCTCMNTAGAAPCGNSGAAGRGCSNSAQVAGAELFASGLPSVAASSLVLSGRDLPPGSDTIFFQGDNDLNGGSAVFGDGLRCVGGNLRRLQIVVASPSGEVNSTVGIPTVHGNSISQGQTKYYQLWYRDTFGSPCGAQFNSSNALAITWLP